MTTMQRIVVAVGLVMGLSAAPVAVWAAEHGGTTLGGSKEHGGTAVSAAGSHEMMSEMNESALLREAAMALRKGEARPDLAKKLEEMAKKEMKEPM